VFTFLKPVFGNEHTACHSGPDPESRTLKEVDGAQDGGSGPPWQKKCTG